MRLECEAYFACEPSWIGLNSRTGAILINATPPVGQHKEASITMPLPADTQRLDPYKNFKVRLRCDGKYVYGGNQVAGAMPFSIGASFRPGGDPSTSDRLPGHAKYPAITLERGLVLDQSFHNWADQVSNFGHKMGSEVSSVKSRKDIFLELYDEAGHLAMTYRFFRCWVSGYKVLPNLDANANAVAIEHMHLENEGFMVDHPYRARR